MTSGKYKLGPKMHGHKEGFSIPRCLLMSVLLSEYDDNRKYTDQYVICIHRSDWDQRWRYQTTDLLC